MNRTDAGAEDFPDLPTLWADLQDLEDNNLTPKRREALMELLKLSPQARREYFQYFHQVAVLRMEASKTLEAGQISRSVIPMRKPAWWKQPWMAAAAVLTLAALIGHLVLTKQRPAAAHMRAVAVEQSRWEINGVSQTWTDQGTQVKAGDSIHLISGTVKLRLASGSTIVMQGASRASFPALNKPVVHSGWLWINTGQSNATFEVSTPELVVKDLGTRFGVRIGENGASEVHLLDGGVKVLSRESGITLATLSPDGKGRAIAADGTRSELPLADDPFPLLQNLLSGRSGYGNAVIVQKPSGYWKFDEATDASYDNQVRGQHRAKSGSSVSIHPTGVGEDGRFSGLHSFNKSLYFHASEYKKPGTSVLAFLDGSEGVTRRQGAITFWIKQKEGVSEAQVLWLACKDHPKNFAPTQSHAYSYVTAAGHVVFLMENGPRDIRLESDRSIHDGQWHHVGLSWGINSADLYVNGRRVAHQNNEPPQQEWVSHGSYVRFGKPSDELHRQGIHSFHGSLDEFSVWDRPLTPDEVAQQFQAALGTGSD